MSEQAEATADLAFWDEIGPRLVRLFRARGSHVAEDLASETIVRVLGTISSGTRIRDVTAFAIVVARNVFFEDCRKRMRERWLSDTILQWRPDTTQPDCGCLSKVIHSTLGEQETRLLAAYYGFENKKSSAEDRKAIARAMGVSPGSLRLRVMRIRAKLLHAMRDCGEGCSIRARR